MGTSVYTVSDYLCDRLAELGINHVFGVPGDFTLSLLDHVVGHPDVEWVGCTNELNAGYAADGYARLRGAGALMTTFGVGELSAINAIAGSFAEHVPVVHIVGSPSVATQAAQRIVHHSLGDGVFTHFAAMHADITCASAALTADNAAEEIDRVLVTMRHRKLPGYLLVPSDVAAVPAAPPAEPLPPPLDATDPDALAGFADAARRLLAAAGGASRVSVLAGLLVHRFEAAADLRRLLDIGLPHASTAWAKSVVDEADPGFLGIYTGGLSAPAVRRAIEDAGALILAGVQFTDLNSGFFTQTIPRARTIELGAASASVAESVFGPITIGAALRELAAIAAELPSSLPPDAPPSQVGAAPAVAGPPEEQELDQDALWSMVTAYLRPGDVVLADQGTSFFGMADRRLPTDVTFIGQPLWASIGYTLPALLGASLARPAARGVLLIGDGAAQMTATELSTILRHGLWATVIVVDNDGYTVERAIHGPDEPYNDIARWDWTALPGAFASGAGQAGAAYRPTTTGALAEALDDAASHPGRFTLIQPVLPRLDIPQLLADIARSAAAANAGDARHESPTGADDASLG